MQADNDTSNKTDEELVALALESQRYFAYLIERYEPKLLRYIFRISSVRQEEAEDILQEVFIKTYLNLNDFNQDLKFSSWIYRITHNQAISHFRKKKTRPQSIMVDENRSMLENLASNMDLNYQIDQKYLKVNLLKAMDSLHIKYREVLVLRYFEHKDYKEISDILKKPPGSVASLLSRAKEKLRQTYKQYE